MINDDIIKEVNELVKLQWIIESAQGLRDNFKIVFQLSQDFQYFYC